MTQKNLGNRKEKLQDTIEGTDRDLNRFEKKLSRKWLGDGVHKLDENDGSRKIDGKVLKSHTIYFYDDEIEIESEITYKLMEDSKGKFIYYVFEEDCGGIANNSFIITRH
jgi:hypothetical protein